MVLKNQPSAELTVDLIETIRAFPVAREVEHCGTRFVAATFDYYVNCPQCRTRIKVRSFSGVAEIEDVFDAIFEWMNQAGAEVAAEQRRAALREED